MPTYANPQDVALESGRLFVGSTAELNPSTGEGVALTLKNPSGSGVKLHVVRLVTTVSTGPVFPHLFKNPDSNTPSTSRNIMDANTETDNSSSAELKADTQSNDMSGGTDTGIEFGLQSGVTVKEEIDTLIPEGGTLGLNVPAGGALVGEQACFNIWWMES